METIKKNALNYRELPNADPRIDSPQIKVVYPSLPKTLETIPVQTVASTVTPPPPASTQPEIPAAKTANDPEQNAPAKTGWLDAIKQNAGIFALIGLALLGIGFLIGKNKAS